MPKQNGPGRACQRAEASIGWCDDHPDRRNFPRPTRERARAPLVSSVEPSSLIGPSSAVTILKLGARLIAPEELMLDHQRRVAELASESAGKLALACGRPN
jgi:hypothetical protein